MIRLGGGIPVEVGQANEVHPEDIEENITQNTVALLYKYDWPWQSLNKCDNACIDIALSSILLQKTITIYKIYLTL